MTKTVTYSNSASTAITLNLAETADGQDREQWLCQILEQRLEVQVVPASRFDDRLEILGLDNRSRNAAHQ